MMLQKDDRPRIFCHELVRILPRRPGCLTEAVIGFEDDPKAMADVAFPDPARCKEAICSKNL